jgi:acyl transferase domain-containing protein/acyl carrier protein
VEILSSPGSGKLFTLQINLKEKNREIIFMFPGQGAQYVNMGLELYCSERVFREEMDRCFEIYRSLTGSDIKEILYPTPPAPSGHPSQEGSRGGSPCPPRDCVGSPGQGDHRGSPLQPDQINQTAITQPVVFMFEYALAKMLFSWGIQPTVMIGYSFGEYTAACLSGVFSLEDAIRLVALRGRLMQQMPEGSMLSVPLPADELKPWLNDKLAIAIDNGPSCVVSGTTADIDEFEKDMKKRRYLCIRVAVSHAGHSTVLNPILTEFAEALKKVELKEPQIPYISNVTAAPITSREVMGPGYWLRHLKDTVRFGEGIAGLLAVPDALFIEIGPGRDLCVLLKSFKDVSPTHRMINLVRHEKEDTPDLYYLLNKLGHLWLYGVDIDWKGFYADEQRLRLPLPTYSFDRQYFKIENIRLSLTGESGKESKNLLKKVEDIDKWFFIPLWKRSRIPRSAGMFTQPQWMQVLLFMDECGLGSKIAVRLRQHGYRVVLVRVGEAFTRIKEDEYRIHPAANEDYEALFHQVTEPGQLPPLAIFHLWNVTPISSAINEPGGSEWVEKEQDKGFFSLIALVRTLGKKYPSNQIQVKVVTNNVQDVLGGEVMCPEKATVIGPVKCIIQEFSHIDCCAIDILLPEPGSSQEQQLVSRLVEEFQVQITVRMIAYRGNHRWVQSIEPVELAKPPSRTVGLKEEGVYLVTGGLGGIGLILAEHLGREAKARLILTGRSQFPPREEWDHWLAGHDPEEKISRRIRKIRELEALGARVLVSSADVANFQQMRQVITRAEQQFGKINGVIHAAGVPDGALIIQRTREMSKEILAPKVTGTLVLDQLLKDTQLDFFLFCSSMAALLPPGGQTAYAAANAFLDAFALSNTVNKGITTISINWDRWQNTGVAVILEEQHRKLWGQEMVVGITPAEGIDLFSRILADPLPQVAVCPIDLIPAIREYYKSRGVPFADSYKAEVSHESIHQRPQLTVEYVEPGSKTEKKLAQVWQNFLGIDCVGIYDNFFELGATSLDIIQVNGRLVEELKKDIPLVSMYSYPTVKLLAKFIDQGNGKGDILDKEKEKLTFAARDKGEEKKRNLRMRRREIQ